jgi:hypothetical protein
MGVKPGLSYRGEHRLNVSQKGVPRKIFEPERDEVTREWRKAHNQKLQNLYPSPNIIRVIKSRRMRWVGHVARMGKQERCIQSFGGGI